MTELQVNYRDAKLKVELDSGLSARLFINNIQRVQESAEKVPSTIRLTSTVQTDYEWHEFIEAEVKFTQDEVTVTLSANNAQIASETFPPQESS